jgi:heat shock protein HtpX
MNTNYFTHSAETTAKTTVLLVLFIVVIGGIGAYAATRFGNQMIFFGSMAFSLVISAVSWWFSDSMALRSANAELAERTQYPEYHRIVNDLCMRANLPVPRLYIIPDDALNAFATGRDKNHAAVAVTRGLLQNLNTAELSGVIAHELAHIGNRDILLMSVTSVVAGLIAMIADFGMRSQVLSGDDNRGGVVSILIMIGSSILASIGALLITSFVSRRREFLADETGALITGDAPALASALRRIAASPALETASNRTAHMYISNPFGAMMPRRLFATHPPIEERIGRLEMLK